MELKDELIMYISKQSNRYGNKLLDFMDRYGLTNLQEATVAQLSEYINNMYNVKLSHFRKSNITLNGVNHETKNESK